MGQQLRVGERLGGRTLPFGAVCIRAETFKESAALAARKAG
jgi:hypothetical protein